MDDTLLKSLKQTVDRAVSLKQRIHDAEHNIKCMEEHNFWIKIIFSDGSSLSDLPNGDGIKLNKDLLDSYKRHLVDIKKQLEELN